MRHILSTSVIVSLLIIFTDAQTFQYSRGWTNGKRSSPEHQVSAAAAAAASHVLLPHLTAGLTKQSNDECRLLIQRFLKSPCDVRLANAIVSRNRELLREIADDVNDGTALLYDPNPAVLSSDSVASDVDEDRFKRNAAVAGGQRMAERSRRF